MEWYLKCLKQYVDFSSRARRKEYWMFFLFNFMFAFIFGFIDGIFGWIIPDIGLGVLILLYSLAVFLPGLAVAIRRLHDIGKSGWCLFLSLIPLIGSIILIVWFCKEGETGFNAWGPNPKNI